MKLSLFEILTALALWAQGEQKDTEFNYRPQDQYRTKNLAPIITGASTGSYAQPTRAMAYPTGYPTATAAASSATTHKVDVGSLGQLVFSPNQVEAAVGDVVQFNFLALNHTVTQSEFASPCTFNGGFDTGFGQFNPKNETGRFVQSFVVKDKKPQWFYCRQGKHCAQGMVFGINPAGKMDQFIQNAKSQGVNASSIAVVAPSGTAVAVKPPTPVTTAAGAVTTVTVGLDKGKTLKFDPPFLVNKKRGDIIRFDFRALNHTLTESSFDDPCKKLAGTSIDTNFDNANPNDVPNFRPFDMALDTDADKPRWFYCKQGNGQPNGHCAKGMVFAINPKSEDQFKQFMIKAESTLPKIKGRGLKLGELA